MTIHVTAVPSLALPRVAAGAEATVVVVGAGGNIGSHLVPHLGRMRGLGRVVLVDRERYEEKNLWSQDIARRDVGWPKALVQARRLRRINRALQVTAVAAPLEDVPAGRLRGAVILCGLDSRSSRQYLNELTYRLGGIPWLDAGVAADGLLARVTGYSAAGACLECRWDDSDYALLEQRYPCLGAPSPAATNAPSHLGALAAALLATECHKLLAGAAETSVLGREVMVDLAHHTHFVARLERRPGCRHDHLSWVTSGTVSPAVRLADALSHQGISGGARLRVHGRRFALARPCGVCGLVAPYPRFVSPLCVGETSARREPGLGPQCARCAGHLSIAGTDTVDAVDVDALVPQLQRAPLRALGLRCGDLLRVESERGEVCLEVAPPAGRAKRRLTDH